MMVNKDIDFLKAVRLVDGRKLEDHLLIQVIEESGSTFGDVVDSLIKTYVSREFDLEL